MTTRTTAPIRAEWIGAVLRRSDRAALVPTEKSRAANPQTTASTRPATSSRQST